MKSIPLFFSVVMTTLKYIKLVQKHIFEEDKVCNQQMIFDRMYNCVADTNLDNVSSIYIWTYNIYYIMGRWNRSIT